VFCLFQAKVSAAIPVMVLSLDVIPALDQPLYGAKLRTVKYVGECVEGLLELVSVLRLLLVLLSSASSRIAGTGVHFEREKQLT
jgi:hypothetical protein